MKRIATFVACIAAFAMLSGPTSIAHADKGKKEWKQKGSHGKYKSKEYREREREGRKHREEMERETRKHRQEMRREGRKHRYKARGRRHGGPPPWAPAHGYRAKHKFKYRHRGHVYIGTSANLLSIPDTGMASCNRQVVGGLLGAAAGGFLGSKVGSGSGQIAAVIGGTVLGALVGGNIGQSMDRIDQNCVGQALERAPTGQPVAWNNPDRGGQYQVTPTRTFEASGGQYCREYQTKIIIEGREQNGFGTACRQPDGSWKRN